MGIRLRGSTWWADFTAPSGRRIRCSLETEDKKQAQELFDTLKAEAWRQEKLGEKPKKTFDEAALRWIREMQHKHSLDDDKTKITFFIKYFSGKPLASISANDIKDAVAQLQPRIRNGHQAKTPVSNGTRNRYLSFMRSLLRRAEREWGWLDKAPALSLFKEASRRIRWLTHEEADRLIQCAAPHLADIIKFALATGLRRSNIVNLEWSQIDMQRRVAWVHPDQAKGGKGIGVALNDTACAVLREQIGKHSRWVFVTVTEQADIKGKVKRTTQKMRVDSNTGWTAALRRAGIEDFRFHDLRHTWASWLVQAGVPLSVLQEMGGWESIEMVRRYAHLAPSHLTEHARQIDTILGGFGTNTAQMQKGPSDETA